MAYGKRRVTVRTELEREEALDRARNGSSVTNEMRVISGFTARGIAREDIKPRENCLSYGAWQALGRQVLKGQRGVKVLTMVMKEDEKGIKRKVWREASVFHVSQTLPEAEANELRRREAMGHATPVVAVAPVESDEDYLRRVMLHDAGLMARIPGSTVIVRGR